MNDATLETAPETAATAPAPTARRRLAWRSLTLLPALLAMLFLFQWPAWRWGECQKYAYQLDAEEGFILNQALMLGRGESIYQPIGQPPYLVGNYPPLFPWALRWINGPTATKQSLPRGRMLVAGAACAVGLLLIVTVYGHTRRIIPALLAPLLFLVSYEVYHWTPFVRVDHPALALTLLGAALFILGSERRWTLMAAGAAWLAAGYTRQTAILAPLAAAIALGTVHPRQLGWMMAPWAGGGLAILAVMQSTTHGEFWRHLVVYNDNQLDWFVWRKLMRNEIWLYYRWWLLAMAVMGAGALARKRTQKNNGTDRTDKTDDEEKNQPYPSHSSPGSLTFLSSSSLAERFTAIYAVFGTLSLLMYAKVGAAPNYVLEPLAAWALWTGCELARRCEPRAGAIQRRFPRPSVFAAAALLMTVHAAHLVIYAPAMFSPYSSPPPKDEDIMLGERTIEELQNAQGPVYCEEPLYTMLAGRPVEFQAFVMTQLAEEKKWDPEQWIRRIEARDFALMIVRDNFWLGPLHERYMRYTSAMARAIRDNYRPVRSYNPRQPVLILAPRQPPSKQL